MDQNTIGFWVFSNLFVGELGTNSEFIEKEME
jgi:hypothetical protein